MAVEKKLEMVLVSRYGPDCRHRVQPLLAEWYEGTAAVMWKTIRTLTSSSSEGPSIAVVHSPQSLPQLLTLQDETFLVYDQHLGQVFARLTRLSIGRASPAAVDAYLCKLAGIRLLARGRWGPAAVMAAARHSLGERAGPLPEDHDSAASSERLMLTQGQETFILGHELAHHLRFADAKAFDSFDQDVVNILEQWKAHRQQSKLGRDYVIDELTRSAVGTWERRHGPLKPDQVAQVRKAFDADTGEVGLAQDAQDTFAAFMSDAKLREEATCDVLASMAAVPALMRSGMSPANAVAACAYAMHHLRLVQTVNAVADGVDSGTLSEGVRVSMTRLTILRACLGVLLEAVFPPEVISSDLCHQTITEVNLLHSEVVADQLWLMTGRTLRELLGLEIQADPPLGSLRATLGFGALHQPHDVS